MVRLNENEPNKALEPIRMLVTNRAFSSLRSGTIRAKHTNGSVLTLGKKYKMKHNYILVDYENVQEIGFERLVSLSASIVVFVGVNTRSIPLEMFKCACNYPGLVEIVESVGQGHNALDFQIACYAGALSEWDSNAFIHVLSKDKGFDIVVSYLKANGKMASRSDSFDELKLFYKKEDFSIYTSEEKRDLVLTRLAKSPEKSRPRKLNTLASTINTILGKQIPESEVKSIIEFMAANNKISISQSHEIAYNIPEIIK